MNTESSTDPLASALAKLDDLTEFANLFVQHPELRKQRHAKVLCEQRDCTLAKLYTTTSGLIVYIPRYKLSPTENARRSSQSGREANTIDGERRWKSHAYFLEHALNVTLTCDHIRQIVIEADEVRRMAKSNGVFKISG